jgi:hypothetical protein
LTNPQHSADACDPEKELDAPETATIFESVKQGLATNVFHPEFFDEMHDVLGNTRMRLALEEMSSSLRDVFPAMSAEDDNRDQIFLSAHKLVTRAGLMGFLALRDACLELQDACTTGVPINAEYMRAREIILMTRVVIASLLKRPF